MIHVWLLVNKMINSPLEGRSRTCGTTKHCFLRLVQAASEHLSGPTRTIPGLPNSSVISQFSSHHYTYQTFVGHVLFVKQYCNPTFYTLLAIYIFLLIDTKHTFSFCEQICSIRLRHKSTLLMSGTKQVDTDIIYPEQVHLHLGRNNKVPPVNNITLCTNFAFLFGC